VVIVGLVGVTLAKFLPGLDWMHLADSVAALVVAVIVIYVSAELGWRTIVALLDSAPKGMVEKVERAAYSIPDVIDAHAIRIRPSGPNWFVDLHVTMNGSIHLSRAHANTELIEKAVQAILPGADVTVHVEPAEEKSD
jgi:cation diffusion facilitator family transporter